MFKSIVAPFLTRVGCLVGFIIPPCKLQRVSDRVKSPRCLCVMSVTALLPGLHTCFSCQKADRETEMCVVSSCGRFYHRSCALLVETTQLHKNRLHCPLHTCATCFADADDDDVEGLRQQAVRGTTTSC